jgi:tetratricopeptide (TPR) repeat protein
MQAKAIVPCEVARPGQMGTSMSAEQPDKQKTVRLAPVSPAVRQRLQTVFEHAQRCVEKADHDYAHDLYTQCISEDPANLIYLQQLLSNLSQKYGNNRKGVRLAGFKIRGARAALVKSAAKGLWREAFLSAGAALRSNPWDVATLLTMADAYEQMGSDECMLYTLRWALDAAPKNVVVNRRAAVALTRLGQFDQAITCWRRVEQAKPRDLEATNAISQLSVEKAIQQGGYNQDLLRGDVDVAGLEESVRARVTESRASFQPPTSGQADASAREQALAEAIQTRPAELTNYVVLAELLAGQERLREAEEVLTKALAASGGGDLSIRERLEDVHLRRAYQQVDIAERRAQQQKTQEASELAQRMVAQLNQAELEVYAARSGREPSNLLLQYELGLRCQRAGRFKEAISALQRARGDAKHRAMVQIHLGECFQHIRQFTLAMSSYEAAVEAADTLQPDVRKLALYRAGVLAAELKDLHKAEKYLTELAAVDFGYRDVPERLDKLAALRDSV